MRSAARQQRREGFLLDPLLEEVGIFLCIDARSWRWAGWTRRRGHGKRRGILVQAAASTEAFHGRFDRARDLSARAAALALRGGSTEMAATWLAERRFAT